GLESVNLGLNAETVTRQSRLDEADVAPPGYTLLHAGIGLSFPLAGRGVSVDLTARNLLNTEYASFMSRYKEYALDMGRNLALRVELGW
ncbi:MAG: TonB-dependent receptor, partial [Gemmatimonadales bacterium]|nr:TonB-dependent receptor [Gemmatimonadales bacterium]